MARNTTLLLLLVLKLFMAVLLAAWACIWIIRPTQSWKRSWHVAEDRANATFLGDYGTMGSLLVLPSYLLLSATNLRSPTLRSGLTVVVYCLPVLAVATVGYISLHIAAKKDDLRYSAPVISAFLVAAAVA